MGAYLATLLRLYSYLYHLILCLFLVGISGLAKVTDISLKLDMLPWKGDELINWLFYGSVAGLLITLLAITGIFRYLFPLWALVVCVLMVRGYLLQPYSFSSTQTFYYTLALIGGTLLAFLGSLMVFKTSKRRRR